MKKIAYTAAGLTTLAFPGLAAAQIADAGGSAGGAFGDLLANILTFTNSTLIPFIIGIGFLVFVFGMFQYFIAGGANEENKEAGKSLMIYATLGFVLIIVFWGVVNLLTTSTGLNEGLDASTVPKVTPITAT